MSQRVTAIYENGVLRPLAPLDLPEHTQVEIEIDVDATHLGPDERAAHAQAMRTALRRAGVSSSPIRLSNATTERLSVERRDELARVFAGDRPLADLISEDREEW